MDYTYFWDFSNETVTLKNNANSSNNSVSLYTSVLVYFVCICIEIML